MLTREEVNYYLISGYEVPRWLLAKDFFTELNFQVKVIKARTTKSKYLYISNTFKQIKIRYSDHQPNPNQEASGDSDFYVGKSNSNITSTEYVLPQVLTALGIVNPQLSFLIVNGEEVNTFNIPIGTIWNVKYLLSYLSKEIRYPYTEGSVIIAAGLPHLLMENNLVVEGFYLEDTSWYSRKKGIFLNRESLGTMPRIAKQ
jgi:hypothetical protein